MNDLINRADAIEAIEHICPVDTEYDCTLLDRVDVRYVLSDLPSAERKRGKWIPVTNGRGGFECSECHSYAPSYKSGDDDLSNFCPNCGADMRGEK